MKKTKYLTSYKYSPYAKINKKRIKKAKFIYRFTKKLILNNKKKEDIKNICDLGCANGEFIFYLAKHFKTKFIGVDNDKGFIRNAEKLLSKYDNVQLLKKNLFNLKGKFDVITCLGTATTFPFINELMHKIISLLSPQGVAIIDGIFNKYDCDLIIKFKDSSKKELNFWNSHINIHSQKTTRNILNKFQNINFFFKEKDIDVAIKKENKKPHHYWWTEKNKAGNYYLTSGLMIKKRPTFLIIKKRR